MRRLDAVSDSCLILGVLEPGLTSVGCGDNGGELNGVRVSLLADQEVFIVVKTPPFYIGDIFIAPTGP